MNLTIKDMSFAQANLKHISLTGLKGDKVAILGQNGSGKSTIMKIIVEIFQPDSGTVATGECWAGSIYVQQEPSFDVSTPFELAMRLDKPDQLLKWLAKLDFVYDDSWLEKPFSEMSGGQKKATQLAFAFAQQPDILLLDEPENHLDIIARQKLISVMENFKGILLFVSHDRNIVNQVSTSIAFIEDGELELYSDMNVEDVLISKAEQIEASKRRWISEGKAIEQLKKAVAILRLKTSRSTKGTGVYRSRKRELENRLKDQKENRPDTSDKKPKFKISDPEKKKGKLIFQMIDASFSYKTPILKQTNAQARFGERIGILGRNGSGKTTFLRLLQDLTIQSGKVVIGPSIKFGWFGQQSNLDSSKSALELIEDAGVVGSASPAFAARILLNYNEARVPISNLSGGQISRLRVALMLKENPDCIILDEPTNNLDAESWEELAQAFANYKGTLIVVSHDESFLDRLELEKFWVIKNTILKEFFDFNQALETISTK